MLRAAYRDYWLYLLVLSLLTSGCAMCASTDDYAYSASGGRWQRANMTEGRVGSVFAPAEGTVVEEPFIPFEASPPAGLPGGDFRREPIPAVPANPSGGSRARPPEQSLLR